MAYNYAALEVAVTASTAKAAAQIQSDMTKAGDSAGKSASTHMSRGLAKIAPIASSIGKSAVAGFGLATTAAVGFGVKAVEAGEAANKVNAQTAAVIKSTGGVANVTAQSVKNLAMAISLQTGISGGAVKAGDNMLLTFRNVRNEQGKGNDVFNQATHSLTDMTAAMTGGNVTQEAMRTKAIMLGKALNDPVKGVTALSRVGVQFTDQQKAQITTLTESGHTLEAQKIILGELNKEFGGSAAAMATPSMKISTAFKSIKTSIGQAIIEAIDPLMGSFAKLAQLTQVLLMKGGTLTPIFHAIGVAAGRAVVPLTALINKFTKWMASIKPGTMDKVVKAIEKFGPALAAAGAAAAVFTGAGLGGEIPVLGPMIEKLLGPLNMLKGAMVSVGKAALVQMVPALEESIGPVEGLGKSLGGMAAPIGIAVAAFGLMMAVSPQFRKAVMDIAKAFMHALVPALMAMMPAIQSLVPPLTDVAKVMGGALAVALEAVVPLIKVLGGVLKFLAPILPKLVEGWLAYQVAVKAAALAQWAMDAAMDANPIGIVITVLAVLVVALIAAWQHSATFRKIIVGTWHAILDAAQWVWHWLKQNWPYLIGILTGPIGIAVVFIIKHWNLVKQVTKDVWTWIKGFLRTDMTDITGVFTSSFNRIKSVTLAAWNWIGHFIRSVVDDVRDFLQARLRAIVAFWTARLGAIKAITQTVWNAIKWFISGTIDSIRKSISAGLNAIAQAWKWWGDKVRSLVSGAISAVRNIISDGMHAVEGTVSGAVSNMLGKVRSLASGFFNAGKAAIAGLLSGIGGAIRGISGWIKSHVVDPVVNAVKHWFGIHSPSEVMSGVGENVTAGFIEGIVKQSPLTVAKKVFGGIPDALGHMVMKGLVDIGSLPGKAVKALGHLGGWFEGGLTKIGGFFGKLFGGGGSGVGQWAGLMHAVLNHFGIPQLFGTFMTQMQTESGGNPRAINLWDSNAAAGHPSKGLMQTIDGTFNAYAGPYRSRGIYDPLANIYAAVAYAIDQYGSNIVNVLGHGHGYAKGGMVTEPVFGMGLRSGEPYSFGENGPEMVTPVGKVAGRIVVNVFPQPGQSETEIAAAVSRRLAWAVATGRA